jgi:hypothetical protein
MSPVAASTGGVVVGGLTAVRVHAKSERRSGPAIGGAMGSTKTPRTGAGELLTVTVAPMPSPPSPKPSDAPLLPMAAAASTAGPAAVGIPVPDDTATTPVAAASPPMVTLQATQLTASLSSLPCRTAGGTDEQPLLVSRFTSE